MNVKKMMLKSFSLLLVAVLLFAAMPAGEALADTLDVCSTCTYTSIQAAINAASPGDTISVAAGTYNENLTIDKAIDLIGAGRDVTTVQAVEGRNYNGGGFQSPIVKITGDAALLNLLPIEITAPESIAGLKNGSLASFGPQPGDTAWNVSGDVVYSDVPLGGSQPGNVSGKIALIDRGDFGFSTKAYNAQQGGAIGVIIANTDDDLITMGTSGEDVTIPVVMITLTDGNLIKAQTETVTAAFQANPYDTDGESVTITGFTFSGNIPSTTQSDIVGLSTQGIETDSSTYDKARQNITVTDNRFMFCGKAVVLYSVTGFDVSNNIAIREEHGGQIIGGGIIHTSGSSRGLISGNTGFDPESTISLGGSDMVVSGNVIEAPATPLSGDYAIAQHGIRGMYAYNIEILNNTISGLKAGEKSSYTYGWPGAGIWLYSTTSGIEITGNNLQNNAIGVATQSIEPQDPPVLRHNKFLGNNYSVFNHDFNRVGTVWTIQTASVEIDALENYWGSEAGPTVFSINDLPASTWDEFYDVLDTTPAAIPDYAVSDMVKFIPWCQDDACNTIVPNANGVIEIPAGTSGDVVQQYLNNAPSGSEIHFLGSPGSLSGGFIINTPGLIIKLQDLTVIQNNSPCFVINADNTTISGPPEGTASCIPTGSSSGIEVDGYKTNIVIEGFEIDGSDQITGDGINFAGAIADLIVRDMFIHDLDGDGIYFTTRPSGYVDIQGNLFKGNAGVGVEAPEDLDVTYNAWGAYGGPTAGDGVSTNITSYDPWTHVDLYLEDTTDPANPFVNEVLVTTHSSYDTITYEVKANLQHATGAEFEIAFDPAKLEVTGVTEGLVFPDPAVGASTVVFDNTEGVISFAGTSLSEQSGEGLILFSVTFTGKAAGTSDLAFGDDLFSMLPQSSSVNIYANNLEDGGVLVRAHFSVTGTVSMQARTVRAGVLMTLTQYGLLNDYGPFPVTSTSPISHNLAFSEVVADTYAITITQDRYLDVTTASGKTVDITAATTLNPIMLLGGDVNNDNAISIGDASVIGADYGGDINDAGDVNFDNLVNIQDLAMVGGNFDLESSTAYNSWTP